MKQYCRYCIHLYINNFPYCDKKEKALSESYCKKTNNCNDYVFADCEPEYQDAFMENVKGYKPREKRKPKQKEYDGQISLFDKESESDEQSI